MYTATILNRFKTKKSALLTVALVALSQILLSWGVVFASGLIPSKEGVFYACYVTHASGDEREGQLRVVSDPSNCQRNETAVSWNKAGPIGPQGPPGEFSGHFASPNGAFSIDVDDNGINLQGPSGRIQITTAAILVEEGASRLSLGPAEAVLESVGDTRVDGSQVIVGENSALVRVGGTTDCKGFARIGDLIPGHGWGGGTYIHTASSRVLECEP